MDYICSNCPIQAKTNTIQAVFMTDYKVTHVMYRYDDMKAASSEDWFKDTQGILLQVGVLVQGNPSVGAITKYSAQTDSSATSAADRGLYIINNGNRDFGE